MGSLRPKLIHFLNPPFSKPYTSMSMSVFAGSLRRNIHTQDREESNRYSKEFPQRSFSTRTRETVTSRLGVLNSTLPGILRKKLGSTNVERVVLRTLHHAPCFGFGLPVARTMFFFALLLLRILSNNFEEVGMISFDHGGQFCHPLCDRSAPLAVWPLAFPTF